MKFKKGDRVVIIAGKDKTKTGLIKEIDPIKNQIVVENINIRTHHIKPSQQNQEGGIVKLEGPIAASNAMLDIGTKSKPKVTRITYKIETNNKGKKVKKRIAKKTGEEV